MKNRYVYWIVTGAVLLALYFCMVSHSFAKTRPPEKSKFYDFSEQLINGQVRKPRTFYINVRDKVKFERLLPLKKSFLRQMFDTAKERIFK